MPKATFAEPESSHCALQSKLCFVFQHCSDMDYQPAHHRSVVKQQTEHNCNKILLIQFAYKWVAKMVQKWPVLANFDKHIQNELDIAWPHQWVEVSVAGTRQSFLKADKSSCVARTVTRHQHELLNSFLIVTLNSVENIYMCNYCYDRFCSLTSHNLANSKICDSSISNSYWQLKSHTIIHEQFYRKWILTWPSRRSVTSIAVMSLREQNTLYDPASSLSSVLSSKSCQYVYFDIERTKHNITDMRSYWHTHVHTPTCDWKSLRNIWPEVMRRF